MTDTDHDWFPRHPRLRPGLAVLRHDDGRWQLGTHRSERLVLPDDADAGALMRALRRELRPDLSSPGVRRWAHELVARGLVVSAGDLARALGTGLSRAAVLSAFRHPDGATRVAARLGARLRLDCDDMCADDARALLASAGLAVARADRPFDLVLVVRHRWAPREQVDPWVQRSVPHLWVGHDADGVDVGPFVVPGLTACLRCVDAHEVDVDPGHPTQLTWQASTVDDRPDPLLLRLALTWAIRDLVAYVEGDEPSTWSASVRLDAALAAPRTPWTRHPRCGCAWGDALATG